MALRKHATRAQTVLTSAEPARYYVPPYVGGRGWIGAWLDVDVEWAILEDLLRDGHQPVALRSRA